MTRERMEDINTLVKHRMGKEAVLVSVRATQMVYKLPDGWRTDALLIDLGEAGFVGELDGTRLTVREAPDNERESGA